MTASGTGDELELRVLEAADTLFYERGVAAVTMAQVRDRSGVSLRRLYGLHGAKDELVAAWLAYRHERWMAMFRSLVERELAAGAGAGATATDAVFAALERWMVDTDFRGCGFINSHAELSPPTDEQRAIIRDHKRGLTHYLTTLSPHGEALAVLVDGAIVQGSIFADVQPLRAAATLARQLERAA